MSDLRCSLLKSQLVDYVKMLMRPEGSTFYSPEWAAAASEAKGDEKDKKRPADANAKPDPVKPPKKPKAAKKTKKDKKDDEELVEDTDSASE
ncbi:MAG: hypothetical protein OIF58_10750 [Cohaesibacter sp.]|nr:hypothetical protein [Cohaesibacter sp.]